MTKLLLDTETKSGVDIKLGVYRYVESPDFEVQLTAWSWDGQPAQVVDGIPQGVTEFLLHGDGPIIAHNSQFDRVALSAALWGKGLLPEGEYLDPARWLQDTMFRARIYGYPASLKHLAQALGAPEKDEAGTRLIKKFACPPFASPWEHPEDWQAYRNYCRQDVDTLVEIDRRLPAVPLSEELVIRATERMNDRGIAVDTWAAGVLNSQYLETCEENLQDMKRITALPNPNSQQQLTRWLSDRLGEQVKSIAKPAVAALLSRDDLDSDTRSVLERKAYNGSATAKKFQAILDRACRDGRVHGETQYMGAAATGRFSSRGTQLQNLSHDDQTVDHWEESMTDVMLGRVLSTDELRAMIRPLFVGPFVDADYSQIEARLLAWVAGDERTLEIFRTGRDLYTETAAAMGPQFDRKEGKIATLACLPGTASIATDRGEVPLSLVTTQDRVWDGAEWVSHRGLVYRGERRTITYGSLTATHDHRVWTTLLEQPLPLESAARLRAPLTESRPSGSAVRTVGDHRTRPAIRREMGRGASTSAVPRVRVLRVGISHRSSTRDVNSVSHRQRPWIRTWKPAMGIAKHQRSEHANKQTTRGLGVSSGGVAIRTAHSGASSASRSITGGYSRPSKASRRRASQVLVANRGTTPVYDLVDAGPRHRFTADGVLVHNCGYSGGANALKNFGGERMVPPGEDVDTYLWGVVRAWRDAHPEIVALWDRLMNDFVAGEGWFSAPERGVRELHLPSGRSLYYRNVRAGWDEQYDRPRYTAADPKVFGHQRVITRNILTNNLIQATARDLMASALVKAEQRGLRPVVLVHDEMLCEAPENRAHEVQYAMTAPPSWADGLPLDADPVIMARWVKA